MKNSILIFILFCSLLLKAQLPYNMIPNPGFQNGSGTPRCGYGYQSDFNDDIDYWYVADEYPNRSVVFCSWPTPDWVGRNCDNHCIRDYIHSDRWIYLGANVGSWACAPVREGIRAALSNALETNHEYIFRVKVSGEANAALRMHVTTFSTDWNSSSSNNKRVWNAGNVSIPSGSDQCRVYSMQKVFHVPGSENGIDNIVLLKGDPQSTNSSEYIQLDDVELYPYCTEWMLRQNRAYYYVEEKEEAGYIVAGREVATQFGFAIGNVNMYDGSKTIYKAYREVLLKNGMNVLRGANFHAKIAPCGKECFPPDLGLIPDQTLCDNSPLNIGSPPMRGFTYQWSSVPSDGINYLSGTTVSNPIFTSPNQELGSYKFTVTITNKCGEIATKDVVINYSDGPQCEPHFELMASSNLNADKAVVNIMLHPKTEKINIQVVDCNGGVVRNYDYFYGRSFTGPDFNFFTSEQLNPCGCYNIKVRTKNFCCETWYEQTYHWNRSTSFEVVQLPNVVDRCSSTNNKICFYLKGTASIDFTLYNRWGTPVLTYNGPYNSSPICFDVPSALSDGEYFMAVDFWDCNGVKHTYNYTITILSCAPAMVSHGDGAGLTEIGENLSFTKADGSGDYLSTQLFPNPVKVNGTIQYHLPVDGEVKISLCNLNMEQQSVLIPYTHSAQGDYSILFNNADLPSGVYYYMIEFTTSGKTSRLVKRFIVLH